MADPVTLMVGASMAGSAAQGVLGYIGAKQEGKAQSAMYRYQAGVAEMNKRIAKQNAEFALASGEVEAQQSGMKTRAQVGSARATQGARGLDVNTGSNLRVRESIADVGAHNTAIVRNNAARRAYAYEVEAANATAQGQVYNMAADNVKKSSNLKAISSLIGGATSVADKWYGAAASGMFGSRGGYEGHHFNPTSLG